MVKRDDEEVGTNQGRVRDTDQSPGTSDTQDDDAEPNTVRYRPEMGTVIIRYERQDSEQGRAALP
jgi:hypothetical protein